MSYTEISQTQPDSNIAQINTSPSDLIDALNPNTSSNFTNPNQANNTPNASAETHTNSDQNDHSEQLHLPEVPPPPAPVNQLASLRSLREAQNRTVEDLSGALRLSQNQINALEENRWEALPGAAYIKGFLRNYARALGIDAQPYIDAYVVQTTPASVPADSADATHRPQAAHLSNATHSSHRPAQSKSNILPTKMTNNGSTDIIKNDPQALQSFNHSGEEKAESKGLMWLIVFLVAATVAFLMIWERALWLPTIEPYIQKISQFIRPSSNQSTANTSATNTPSSPSSTDSSNNTNLAAGSQANPSVVDVSKTDTLAISTVDTSTSAGTNTTAAASAMPANGSTLAAATASGLNASANVNAGALAVAGTSSPTALPQNRVIELTINKSVWLDIRDADNNTLHYGAKPTGSYTIKSKPPVAFIIGAADAVKLTVDGKTYDVVGKAQGNVARFTIQ